MVSAGEFFASSIEPLDLDFDKDGTQTLMHEARGRAQTSGAGADDHGASLNLSHAFPPDPTWRYRSCGQRFYN